MLNFRRLAKSFGYAAKGLKKTFREEQNLRVQSAVAGLVLILAWFFGVSRLEAALLVFAVALVLLMEIANSALERIADILKPRLNVYVKEIKDISAAAVFLSSLAAAIVGLLILGPYLWACF